MKKIFMILMAIFLSVFLCQSVFAKDITVKMAWDASTDGDWTKLNFYERVESGAYDYTAPKLTLPQSYGTDGKSTPTEVEIVSDFPDGVLTTKYWVVRASDGSLESVDSNEASFTADLTPLEQFAFTAVYNEVAKSIDMAWNITDARITKWQIFVSDTAGGPYQVLTSIDNKEGMETTYSVEGETLFPAGAKTTKYFTMVAFAPYDIFSANAPEVAITVNKRPPSGVVNFKIILTQQ